ncbi:CDC45-like protein [Cryphonectria parasitica EP155]|uniref:CDC45-like protein n=1 Tax=Cryphonectria parasitica (strain ATCC 38755 / EP155) TaxID=660469 RepID=A0A9P5CS34_CRYP1|nr:CDC45-like protein [Cryphonectria parasitica EP155]KAF3767735.1 CDC45-like protein [Cryphonectria parasitica EP155]
MYLPRSLLSKLYQHLTSTRHPLSPPVLILVALEPDALCACRILTRLLKNDYIPHKIQPVAGYGDLERVGRELVSPMMEQNGGAGGVVACLGVGGMVDLGTVLGLELEGEDTTFGGVEVWLIDSRRPWNLANVFGGFPLEPETEFASSYQARTPVGVTGGSIDRAYKPGKGGIVVFDDGDIEDELAPQNEAYMALMEMPDLEDNGEDLGDSDSESEEEDGDDPSEAAPHAGQKRKSWSDQDEDDESDDDDRPRQRRRSNSSSSIPETPERPKQRGLVSVREQALMSSDAQDEDPPTAAQPPKGPSARTLRRRLLRLRRQNEAVLRDYYRNGTQYSEPISSMVYSLASELGREDNDILWLAIVGVTSMELYGRSSAGVAVPVRNSENKNASGWLGMRGARIRQLLRDEVRRLNPPELINSNNGRLLPEAVGVIPTTARSPEDHSIRLSPEPRLLMVRHWSLYDALLHSPYIFSRLKTYGEPGLKRLHKFLAKIGISLVQCKQNYAHMDIGLKRELRSKLLKQGPLYKLDDLVPAVETDGKDRGGAKDGWGFVRSWGWRATLSAQDVGVVIGALLEVGKHATLANPAAQDGSSQIVDDVGDALIEQGEEWVPRFWDAFDALENIEALKQGLPTAQFLHKAIFNTGTALLRKKQIKHLMSFRMCVVKDSAEASIFNHPGALMKLALWIGEALAEQEKEATGRLSQGGRGTPLVVASLNEKRSVYTIVGTGGGGGPDMAFLDKEAQKKKEQARQEKAKAKEESRRNKQKVREEKRAARRATRGDDDDEDDVEDETESEGSDTSDSDSDEDDDGPRGKGFGLNRFGTAFQDVIAETSARVRIDSFEHCVVEVRKEDLSGFLESLSSKVVVG